MSNKIKLIYISFFFISATIIMFTLPQIGISGTLLGKFYYSADYIQWLITKASKETLTMFLWFEIFDLFLLIPTYTFMIYQLFKILINNLNQSPFKKYFLLPALFDIPETIILILNNAFFNKEPLLIKLLPILSCFKWTFGLCLFLLVIVFMIARLSGNSESITTLSSDELGKNKQYDNTNYLWSYGQLLLTILSMMTLSILISMGNVPEIRPINFLISFITSIIFDFI